MTQAVFFNSGQFKLIDYTFKVSKMKQLKCAISQSIIYIVFSAALKAKLSSRSLLAKCRMELVKITLWKSIVLHFHPWIKKMPIRYIT